MGKPAGPSARSAAALEEQTRVLKEALSSRGSSSTVTAAKTDLSWPWLETRELTRRMSRSFMRNLKMFARWPIPAKGCRLEKIGGAPSSLQGLASQDVPEPVPCGVAVGRGAGRPRSGL